MLKISPANSEPGDIFGYSQASSGDYLVVGAYEKNSQGAAYIFIRNDTQSDPWSQVSQLSASDAETDGRFGWSVDIDGSTVVICAEGSAACYVYVRNETDFGTWDEVNKLVASFSVSGSGFGSDVVIKGNVIAVGAPGNSTVYVYRQGMNGTDEWEQVQRLDASDHEPNNLFGEAVVLGDDILVVGASGVATAGTRAGAAYVFLETVNGTFQELTKLQASDASSFDYFGSTLALDGHFLAVGAFGQLNGADVNGAMYVFSRDSGGPNAWGQTQKITASGNSSNSRFGQGLAMSEGLLVAGAVFDSNLVANSGMAYLFQFNASGNDVWEELNQFQASDASVDDFLGFSISISGDLVLLGALEASTGQVGSVYAFPACGEGSLGFGESCDDGNSANGDGCDSSCRFEVCGDGLVNNNGTEECDDGNDIDSDACTNSCVSQPVCIEEDCPYAPRQVCDGFVGGQCVCDSGFFGQACELSSAAPVSFTFTSMASLALIIPCFMTAKPAVVKSFSGPSQSKVELQAIPIYVPKTQVSTLVFEFLQLSGFAFRDSVPWTSFVDVAVSSWINFLVSPGSYLTDVWGVVDAIPLVFVAIALTVALAIVSLAFVPCIKRKQSDGGSGKPQYRSWGENNYKKGWGVGWCLKITRLALGFSVTTGLIPLSRSLLSSVACTYPVGAGELPYLDNDIDVVCWSESHLPVAVASLITVLLLIAISFYFIPRAQTWDYDFSKRAWDEMSNQQKEKKSLCGLSLCGLGWKPEAPKGMKLVFNPKFLLTVVTIKLVLVGADVFFTEYPRVITGSALVGCIVLAVYMAVDVPDQLKAHEDLKQRVRNGRTGLFAVAAYTNLLGLAVASAPDQAMLIQFGLILAPVVLFVILAMSAPEDDGPSNQAKSDPESQLVMAAGSPGADGQI